MNKSRKTSHILNVFQYDETTGAVTLPSTLSLTAPSAGDNSSKVATTAWARTYVTGLNYLTAGSTTTSDIGEGTNLYYTQTRFNSAFTAKSTSDLTEGTNLYYTTTRFNTAFSGKSTTDLSEGTNLYYTDGRVGTYLTNNSYATQSYVGTQLANLVAAAPATLDTLNELATALGNDPSFATTVSTSIGTKVPQTRTLTINGTAYDLSADRAWTITSMIYPGAGIAVSTGTAWGTSITDNSTNWNTAYGWGNHASAGYLTSATAATTYVSLTGSYANPSWITSLAYSKITGVPAFLTSYTETDPYRVTAVAVSGTSTKTITITRADASTVTTTWTDIDTDTNTYVTSAAFSGGTLTLTRNDAGTVSVSLDGRYYLATNPSGYITGITSSMVTTALGYTPYNSTNPNGYITGITSSNVTTALGYTPYNSSNPSGYITSYTETDTLANVTGRGNTTTSSMGIGSASIPNGKLYINSGSGSDVVALQNSLNTGAYLVFADNVTPTWANAPRLGAISNDMVFKTLDTERFRIASTGVSTFSGKVTTGLLIAQGPGGNYNENVRLPGSTAVISFNTSGDTGAGSYNIVSQTNFQIRNAGGTQVFVMDQSGNLTMTGTVTAPTFSGALSGNAATATTASSLAANTSPTIQVLNFTGVGTNSGNVNQSYAIYQEGGAWSPPFPDLCIGYHTGIKLGAYFGYNGIRFFNNSDFATQTFSVNDGDNHVRVAYNLYVGGTISGSNLSGTNTGDQTNISGNAATATNVAWTGVTGRPTALSSFTNDLGNYGGWITASGNTSGYAGYLPTSYIGGVQANPQTYFNNGVGVKVAMTGSWSTWSDTLWINGYSGGDVKQMCALHTLRNGTPRMAISVQAHDATSYGTYYEFITSYNIASQTVASAGNATTAGGLAVHTDRNNEANKIVRTDGNGYIQAGWINTLSGDNGTSAITRIYASDDGYIRFYTPANFRQVLDVPTRTGGSASGSWSINAATATGQQSGAHFTLNTGGAGYGLVGVYNPDLHQGFFAMGSSYTLGSGGTLANFYGVSWSYDYSGRQLNTGYNLQHCMAVANAGTVYTVIGQGIWTSGLIRASGSISAGGTITGSNLSGTNTGDQTNISGKADGSLKLWAASHPNDYYIVNNWTGSHWRLTTNHGSPVRVGYSDDTGAINSAVGNSYTWSGIQYFETNNGGTAVNNSNSAKLQAYSHDNNSAFMSFHRAGYYAVNFGLDNDNYMRIGGWSAGANRWQLNLSSGATTIPGIAYSQGVDTGNGDLQWGGAERQIGRYRYLWYGYWAQWFDMNGGTGGGSLLYIDTLYATYGSVSDIRYKKEVTPAVYGLSDVLKMNPIKYKYDLPLEKRSGNDPNFHIGFSAQEIMNIVPEAVMYDNTRELYAITTNELIPVLVNAIKELKAEFDNYKTTHP